MTREEILKKILSECTSNWQPALADKYHVSPADISHLLQECGFVNRRFINNDANGVNDENNANSESIDIDLLVNDALKKQRVQELCDKILNAQVQS